MDQVRLSMRSLAIPRFHALVFLIGVVSILTLGVEKFSDDPGVGWHLATGHWILEHRQIPREDPFLHSASPRAWVSDQWLSDIILASFYDAGGFTTLYALLSIIFIFTFFSLLASGLRRSGWACIPATLAVFCAFKIAQVHLILRPVIFGIACFCLLFCLILPLYNFLPRALAVNDVKAWGKKRIIPIGILFVLWANLHPSFFLGLLFLALIYLGLFLDTFFFWHVFSDEEVRARRSVVAGIFVVALVASLLNPYGYLLHQSILSLGSSSFFMNYHQEWGSPDFNANEGHMFLVLLAAILLSFFVKKKPSELTMVDFTLIAFFSYASLDAVRYLPFFGIAVSPYMARAFYFLGQMSAFPGRSTVDLAWARIESREEKNYPGTVFIALILSLVFIITIISGRLPLYSGEYGPRQTVYPYAALEDLMIHRTGAVVAAEPAFGGFITWQGKGSLKAIIDDRNTLLGEQIYKDFEKYLKGDDGWRSYFKGVGATHLLLSNKTSFAKELLRTKELEVRHQDEHFIVFVL